MTELEKPSNLEIVTDSIATGLLSTALASYIGTPLAALLPVLSKSLASERHKKRVEKALTEINQIVTRHEDILRELSDSQYKIINEAILTILQTTEEEKIKYLKTAIENSIKQDTVSISVATLISRILRDITLDEIVFLVKNSEYSRIIFLGEPKNDRELRLDVHSKEGVIVSGLVSLGLMMPSTAAWDDMGSYQFSSLVKTLLGIVST